MSKKLPLRVYVAWQEEGTDGEFVGASTNVTTLVAFGQQIRVGIYELCEVKTAVNKTELVK